MLKINRHDTSSNVAESHSHGVTWDCLHMEVPVIWRTDLSRGTACGSIITD